MPATTGLGLKLAASEAYPIYLDRAGDVLDLLRSKVLEREAQLIEDLVAYNLADTDSSRVRQLLNPCGDIDTIPEDVVTFDDDVADVDADTKVDPVIGRTAGIAFGHARCTSTAHRTASTTLGNSSSRPSPVVLTIRPPYSAIFGSMSSRRWAFNAASVPLSSRPIRREYPATSADTIAASRR